MLEIESGSHGLSVPGPVQNSIAVLGQVITAIENFLDTINWPPRPDAQPS